MTPEEREAHMAQRREDNTLIAAHRTNDQNAQVFVCQRCERAARFATDDNLAMTKHLAAHGVKDIRPARCANVVHTDADRWFGDTEYWSLDGEPLFIYSWRRPRR